MSDVCNPSTGEDRLLPWKQIKELTGLSRTTVWRLQKAGDFPAPVVISPGRVGWREREVMAWARSRRARGASSDRPRSTPLRPPSTSHRVPRTSFEGEGATTASRQTKPAAQRPARTRRGAATNQIHFEF